MLMNRLRTGIQKNQVYSKICYSIIIAFRQLELRRRGYNNIPLKVNCYTGHTYDKRPISFKWQDIDYSVKVVNKAWKEPGIRLFQVLTNDDKLFELCYDEMQDEWVAVELSSEGQTDEI